MRKEGKERGRERVIIQTSFGLHSCEPVEYLSGTPLLTSGAGCRSLVHSLENSPKELRSVPISTDSVVECRTDGGVLSGTRYFQVRFLPFVP